MSSDQDNLQPPDRDFGGGFATGAVRVRPTFFGLAICEELYEHGDGRREWQRSRSVIVISERRF